MRKTIVSAACALGLLISTGAIAGSSQSASDQSQVQPASQQISCRAPVHEGQLLPRAKQCYTQQEWQARQKRMQESIRELQTRALTVNNGI